MPGMGRGSFCMSDGFFRLTRSKRLNGGANLVHQGNGNGCAGTGTEIAEAMDAYCMAA